MKKDAIELIHLIRVSALSPLESLGARDSLQVTVVEHDWNVAT